MTQFKPGDRVIGIYRGSSTFGKKGTVLEKHSVHGASFIKLDLLSYTSACYDRDFKLDVVEGDDDEDTI